MLLVVFFDFNSRRSSSFASACCDSIWDAT
jgi:hypothetical protein